MLFTGLDKFYEMGVKPRIHNEKRHIKGKIGKARDIEIRKSIINIKKYFPDKPIDKLTVIELEEASMKIIFGRTRESVDNVLCMALNWLNKKGLAKNTLSQNFDKYRHEREQGLPFTRIDQERILEYAKLNSKYYFHFMVYFYTGCRPSEIKAIRNCDFDFANNTVFIDGTKTKTSSRHIPILPQLYQFKNNITSTDKNIVTCKVQVLRDELKLILNSLGIDNPLYTLKSTRHSFATRCKEQGIDLKAISKWMGHTNLAMTDHYTHVLSEFEQQQVSKFLINYAV